MRLTLDSADSGFLEIALTKSRYDRDVSGLSPVVICTGDSVFDISCAGHEKWRVASIAINSWCSFDTLLKYFWAWLRI